jgi:hypothetical protein
MSYSGMKFPALGFLAFGRGDSTRYPVENRALFEMIQT